MKSQGRINLRLVIAVVGIAVAVRLGWEYGRAERPITRGSDVQDFRPSYSPDGRSILFTRLRKICVMDPRGRNIRMVHNFPGMQDAPCWSPDGRSVAFVSTGDGAYDIWVATRDGDDPRNLTRDNETDAFPCWSADGRRILFTQVGKGYSSICCVDVASRRKVLLNPEDKSCRSPASSPDGKKIAYVSWKTKDRDIWVMDSDGRNPIQIVFHPGHFDDSPCWSPDGKSIVFTCEKDGPRNLWMVPSAGGQPGPITHHTDGYDLTPSFHPAGHRVVYARQLGAGCQVMLTKVTM